MAHGAPDYFDRSLIQGKYNNDFIPVRVDENGQMFIVLEGQAIDVNNMPSIKGEDAGTPHVIAVDAAGVMLARMKGAYGEVLKDIAVDTNGVMLARMKGSYESEMIDIRTDSEGNMIAKLKGGYEGQSKDVAVDEEGRIKVNYYDWSDLRRYDRFVVPAWDGWIPPVYVNCEYAIPISGGYVNSHCDNFTATTGSTASVKFNSAIVEDMVYKYVGFIGYCVNNSGNLIIELMKDDNNYWRAEISVTDKIGIYFIKWPEDFIEHGNCGIDEIRFEKFIWSYLSLPSAFLIDQLFLTDYPDVRTILGLIKEKKPAIQDVQVYGDKATLPKKIAVNSEGKVYTI